MDIDNDSIQKIPAPPIKSIQSKICKEKEDFNAEKEDLQVQPIQMADSKTIEEEGELVVDLNYNP